MRHFIYVFSLSVVLSSGFAHAAETAKDTAPSGNRGSIEVTADKSLEWYQDKRLYVARGKAKAVRGDMTVTADLLTAHERDEPADTDALKSVPVVTPPAKTTTANDSKGTGTGDIDKMTAEGNVRLVSSKATITGDHGVYDLDKHVAYVTGNHVKYETPEETVTAKESLEYWDDRKIAVARGDAVGIRGDRHVEGDTLTAQFRDMPNGKSELQTMTAAGHVVVITANDVARADHGVYDINRNIAVLNGNVRITRQDGTQLTGDVGEVDFAANQSRLLNQGSGRVRALLSAKTTPKTGGGKEQATAAP